MPPVFGPSSPSNTGLWSCDGVSGNTVSLPPSSVTTLYGTGYTVGIAAPAATRAAPLALRCPARVVDLAGRAVAGPRAGAVRAPGVYLWVTGDGRARLGARVGPSHVRVQSPGSDDVHLVAVAHHHDALDGLAGVDACLKAGLVRAPALAHAQAADREVHENPRSGRRVGAPLARGADHGRRGAAVRAHGGDPVARVDG